MANKTETLSESGIFPYFDSEGRRYIRADRLRDFAQLDLKDKVDRVAVITSQFRYYGCYRRDGTFRASNGDYRNSGFQRLDRSRPLVLSGIRGDAGMAYVTYWTEDMTFISSLTLTADNFNDPLSRTIPPQEYPPEAVCFIVSAAPGDDLPAIYDNGHSLEYLGDLLSRLYPAPSAARIGAFRDLWISAGCSVNDDADPSEMYVCNGLGMSLAEARAVYAAGVMTNVDINARYAGMSIRTHLPSQIRWGASAPAPTTFRGSSVEVVAAPLLTPGTGCFRDCTKLRKASVFSPRGTGAGSDAWAGCKALETLTVAAMVPGSFSLADSPLISLASLQGIISKAWEGMAAFTITVHPDVYAKMTGDTSNAVTEALPEEELAKWMQLPVDAATKNITFITTE